ncbi:mucosal pentraxin-like [Mobula hypostoma]|uniref:mucosal pentraxin-like n=1 Tax=Mobula hypostoma TaxID=723540 RepID=UPI002FC2F634
MNPSSSPCDPSDHLDWPPGTNNGGRPDAPHLGLDSSPCKWILGFLTDRLQSVKTGNNTFTKIIRNIEPFNGNCLPSEWCLFVISVCACNAAASLLLQTLLFSEDLDNAHVIIKPKQPMRMRDFTLCMKLLPDFDKIMSVFSYVTSAHQNQILLEVGREHLKLHLAERWVDFWMSIGTVGWTPSCITWDSAAGRTVAWVNRIPTANKICSQGEGGTSGCNGDSGTRPGFCRWWIRQEAEICGRNGQCGPMGWGTSTF